MNFYILLFTLAAVVFNLTLPLIAGIYIVSDLGGSPYIAAYGVSFFCLGNALSVVFGKPGAISLGPYKLLMCCLLLMSLFCFLCASAQNYILFNLFRFLEGLVSGPLYLLLTLQLLPAHAPKNHNHPTLAIILTCFSITPVIAAAWGGWVAFMYDWRLLFFLNIPFYMALCGYAWVLDKTCHKAPSKNEGKPTNLVSYGLFFVSFLLLGSAIIMGQELDWFRSSDFVKLFFGGLLLGAFFIAHNLTVCNSIIDLSVFKNGFFCFWIVSVGLLFSAYFGMVVLLSLWLKLYVNYTPKWIALLIITMASSLWVPLFLNYKRFDPRYPLLVALLFFAISCFYTTWFNIEINFGRIAFSRVLAGFGLAIFLPPLFRLTMMALPQRQRVESAHIFHLVRILACGLGAALYIILWHRRQVFYHQRLGSNLSTSYAATEHYFSTAASYGLQGKHALAKLNVFLNQQSTVLALTDCFYFMGWVMLGLMLVLLASFVFRRQIAFQ